MRYGFPLLVAIHCLLWSMSVSAQTSVEKAQEHFEKGANLYFVGDYERAIAEFEKANALTPDPIILYNISLAHQKLGEEEAALAVARLASTMEGFTEEDQVRNESRIIALQMAVSAKDQAQSREAVAELDEPDEPPEPEVATAVETEPEATGEGLSRWQWIAVATGGTGVVLTAVATAMELGLRPQVREFRRAADEGDATTYESTGLRIRRQQRLGRVFLYSGLALVAGGATIWVLDMQGVLGAERAALRIGPREVSFDVRF